MLLETLRVVFWLFPVLYPVKGPPWVFVFLSAFCRCYISSPSCSGVEQAVFALCVSVPIMPNFADKWFMTVPL